MKRTIIRTAILAALALAGCGGGGGGTATAPPSPTNPLVGTWVRLENGERVDMTLTSNCHAAGM